MNADIHEWLRMFYSCLFVSIRGSIQKQVVDHPIELGFDLVGKVILHLKYVGEFGKGPAAVAPKIVDPGHSVGVHGGFLLLGVFPPVALDLDDEVDAISG